MKPAAFDDHNAATHDCSQVPAIDRLLNWTEHGAWCHARFREAEDEHCTCGLKDRVAEVRAQLAKVPTP